MIVKSCKSVLDPSPVVLNDQTTTLIMSDNGVVVAIAYQTGFGPGAFLTVTTAQEPEFNAILARFGIKEKTLVTTLSK